MLMIMKTNFEDLNNNELDTLWDYFCDKIECSKCPVPRLKDGRKYCEIDERLNTRKEKIDALNAMTEMIYAKDYHNNKEQKIYACDCCEDCCNTDFDSSGVPDIMTGDFETIESDILNELLESSTTDGYTSYVIGQFVKYLMMYLNEGNDNYFYAASYYMNQLVAINENDTFHLEEKEN